MAAEESQGVRSEGSEEERDEVRRVEEGGELVRRSRAACEQEGGSRTSEFRKAFSAGRSWICHFPRPTLPVFPSTRQTVRPLRDPQWFW